jgi:pimeloyl-ACP methyl ester carboxylesterase
LIAIMTITRRQFCAAGSALPLAAISCSGARPAAVGAAGSGAATAAAGLVRHDHRIASEPGIELFAREVRRAGASSRPPVLLLHGLRVPGLASFDLAVPGGSLAADLAAAGHPAFVLDARGYGGSTRPREMERPPEGGAPLVRSSDVVRDVAAAVDWIRARTGAPRVALFGWATGGHWLGHYASLYSERVSHLILHNTLYGGTAEHPTLGRGSDLEDPRRPGRFHQAAFGAYRMNAGTSLIGAWDRNIPVEKKAEWRDPVVAEAYVAAALASDPTSATRTPPSFRAPCGALEDTFYLATGRQLWDASLIRAPTLVLRSGLDFWSRPEDARRLAEHLVHAPRAEGMELEGATHFVHLDRPERGRARFLSTLLAFLDAA